MRFLFAIVIGLLPNKLHGQFTLSMNSGLGFYKMDEIKLLQTNILSSIPVNAKVTSSFPPYLFFEINPKVEFKNHLLIGTLFSYTSTGGRIYYSDYSGSITSDQLLSSYSYFFTLGTYKNFEKSKLSIHGDLRPGITVTSLKLTEQETLNNSSQRGEVSFNSRNIVIQPTISIIKWFGMIGINACLGYNYTILFGKLNTDGGYLINSSNNSELHSDWSGLRIGAGVSLKFHHTSSGKK